MLKSQIFTLIFRPLLSALANAAAAVVAIHRTQTALPRGIGGQSYGENGMFIERAATGSDRIFSELNAGHVMYDAIRNGNAVTK